MLQNGAGERRATSRPWQTIVCHSPANAGATALPSVKGKSLVTKHRGDKSDGVREPAGTPLLWKKTRQKSGIVELGTGTATQKTTIRPYWRQPGV